MARGGCMGAKSLPGSTHAKNSCKKVILVPGMAPQCRNV